jgi:hypothetical protein
MTAVKGTARIRTDMSVKIRAVLFTAEIRRIRVIRVHALLD